MIRLKTQPELLGTSCLKKLYMYFLLNILLSHILPVLHKQNESKKVIVGKIKMSVVVMRLSVVSNNGAIQNKALFLKIYKLLSQDIFVPALFLKM